MITPFVTQYLQRVAPRIGATLTLEPEYGYVGVIHFRSGNSAFFRNRVFNINPLASVEISKDKHYAAYFLRHFGFPVPDEQSFFSETLNERLSLKRGLSDSLSYARDVGFPVIVKPNSRSQGEGVAKVYNGNELRAAIRRIFEAGESVALVQRYYPWRDIRIVVLDTEVISAYERIPLAVVGDGRRTVRDLLISLQQQFLAAGRDTIIDIDDWRITAKLRTQSLTFKSVMPNHHYIQLLDNANLSTGGTAIDCTDTLLPSFRDLAVRATRAMNLRLCGVDLLVQDLSRTDSQFVVLEVNGAPGLDNYAVIGQDQDARVEDLYLKVLIALERQTDQLNTCR